MPYLDYYNLDYYIITYNRILNIKEFKEYDILLHNYLCNISKTCYILAKRFL